VGSVSRRAVIAAAALGSIGTLGTRGCTEQEAETAGKPQKRQLAAVVGEPKAPPQRLIGDGSTADTGPQPHQPEPERLAPGARPPQFVVFSWDGAGVAGTNLFERFRKIAQRHGAAMTFFLTGLYVLPESQRRRYHPPGGKRGDSAIGFLSDEEVHETIRQLGLAWREGHEIGTHFNGHFCGPGGVGSWSQADWRSEIEQAIRFVRTWKTHTGFTDLPPLPFDYRKELIGGRTPCLEGRTSLLPVARRLGWKYDASSPGGRQVWPGRKQGLWEFPLQSLPFPGSRSEVLSMDYNIMLQQAGLRASGNRSLYSQWREQARDCFLRGFQRAYSGNRAPLFIGNHFEEWNGGIYMDAIEEAIEVMARRPDVRLVSFRQLVAWLEAQDPALPAKFRTLDVGRKPAHGWAAFAEQPPKDLTKRAPTR
jgi:hypothetical protein